MVKEDDDYHSFPSSTNSDDDDTDEFDCDDHRSCSRYTPCNKKKQLHSSIVFGSSISLSNNSKPNKGDIRSVDKESRHRQKFDGLKWRRICSDPHCLLYLNGGIYFEKWLCKKHYLLSNSITKQSKKSSIQLVDASTK